MRAGVALRQTGAPFREVSAYVGSPEAAAVKARSPTGLLPALQHGSIRIWDSLAIGEYLAEEFPNAGLWPTEKAARAHARSAVAEMHSGFQALRQNLPMNIQAHYPGFFQSAAVRHEVARVSELWSDCLKRSGGPFLFGTFTLADAFYAPVVMRFTSYDVQLPPELAAYCEAVRSAPSVADWIRLARADTYRNPAYEFER